MRHLPSCPTVCVNWCCGIADIFSTCDYNLRKQSYLVHNCMVVAYQPQSELNTAGLTLSATCLLLSLQALLRTATCASRTTFTTTA
jgi:hypothetical protein